jgi:hypothetical protein
VPMVEYVVDLTGVETREVVTFDDRLMALCGLPVRERIVRCMDCKYSCPYGDGIECLGPLVQTWDYKNDSPMHNPVSRSGFCYLGKPRETDE